MTNTAIDEINRLTGEYEFPVRVLEDVYGRIQSCQEEHYVALQLRYLQNLIKYTEVERKEG
ncbi:hypothetical protein ERX37_07980 [Macrococcus hajekii]|uniref:DUF6877 domain-containing protein n=1 Tax=Macrococcus hajekii TaxID=198482 RepID=A0A4R6BIW0_9STAP|nr:DUF6877 family protein [Macrococcus hajekii]TDM01431.1 hypothetical protein ERX37_07980 [Macrococcus hajekii]GGA99918.1 hypothetical protein GCM10007190_04960 [Macrococcus hajekii]